MRLLGLDPGLRHTGWGVVDVAGNRLSHVGDGAVHSDGTKPLAERLVQLYRQLNAVLDRFRPDEAAVEETFVNKNPSSTLKLGLARGIALLAPAERGIPVAEYSANLIKKSVVGVGHAEKQQVQMMVRRLLPGAASMSPDSADALAVAICHAHHAATRNLWREPPAAVKPVAPKPVASRIITLSPPGRGLGEGAEPRLDQGRPGTTAAPSPRPSPRGGEGVCRELAGQKPTAAETERARRLRRDATHVEALLWRRIRAQQLDDVKFRRQEPILGFTVDFVAHGQRLIIELDGGQHATSEPADERRTRMLEQAGFRVLRIWNNDVIQNLDGVLDTIRASLGP